MPQPMPICCYRRGLDKIAKVALPSFAALPLSVLFFSKCSTLMRFEESFHYSRLTAALAFVHVHFVVVLYFTAVLFSNGILNAF